MIFARKVWKLLVALKDGMALLFLLLFFMLLYAALTVRPSVGSVKEGALLLSLDGVIVDSEAMHNAAVAQAAQATPELNHPRFDGYLEKFRTSPDASGAGP